MGQMLNLALVLVNEPKLLFEQTFIQRSLQRLLIRIVIGILLVINLIGHKFPIFNPQILYFDPHASFGLNNLQRPN